MQNLIKSVNDQVKQKLADDFHAVTADDLGIDNRAISNLWANSTGIVIRKSYKRTFDHYAGGEYIDKRHITEIGDYVFFSADDDRVAEWLDSGELVLHYS